ncbi:MAG: tRNA (adenosine(37)-N6)-dimethylallyltransferase MiaA [Atopostipes suicloacalis]|nr:tRNA (adenosine(37)-N6)-dimethylallyltransferase MiaA [Atopostipes suicloacalis]
MKKEKIIVIVGPTAVGKTSLSIKIAKKFNGEIISGDSMQIYKDLDIGTAKVTSKEKKGIPHHLIDMKAVEEDYSVADFQKEASDKISDIMDRGRRPIIVGASGLYIESLLFPVSHAKVAANTAFRENLEQFAKDMGNEALWKRLNHLDPKAANKIHPNNIRRVIRALEVYEETGKLFSTFQNERKKKKSRYDYFIIGLNTDRTLLYERINYRVDKMVEKGLVGEAKNLWSKVGPELKTQSTKGIGYKELFNYFNGKIALKEAIDLIKKHSRHYAKRQLTWFRNRFKNIHWYDLVQEPKTIENSYQEIGEFLEND